MEFRSAAATCILFFFFGFLTAPDYHSAREDNTSQKQSVDLLAPFESIQRNYEQDLRTSLQRQTHAHEKFHKQIQDLQSLGRCGDDARVLLVKRNNLPVGANFFEKFSREFRYLSLSLQVAVATSRTLVVEDDWDLLPTLSDYSPSCSKWDVLLEGLSPFPIKSVACLRQSLIHTCDSTPSKEVDTSPTRLQEQKQDLLDPSTPSFLAFGIIPNVVVDEHNALFHAKYYGPDLVVEMPSWPYPRSTYLIDVVPQWERSWGRFWVRSKMANYLWELWHGSIPSTTVAGETVLSQTPYLVMYWISSQQMRNNLALKYGRSAAATQTMDRYMEIAEVIQKEHESSLKTIYTIADGTNDIPLPDKQSLENKWPGWHFIAQVSESGFDEKATLAGLECMRRATHLIGSFQSQTFRLAAELNSAWHSSQYHVTKRRHWTVDIEWFENP